MCAIAGRQQVVAGRHRRRINVVDSTHCERGYFIAVQVVDIQAELFVGTGDRRALVLFPNLFLEMALLFAVLHDFGWRVSTLCKAILVVLVAGVKVGVEYYMHRSHHGTPATKYTSPDRGPLLA